MSEKKKPTRGDDGWQETPKGMVEVYREKTRRGTLIQKFLPRRKPKKKR